MKIRSLFLTLCAALLGLALFAAALATPHVAAQTDDSAPQGIIPLAGDFFVHVATPGTISSSVTHIDHPRLNGDPDAIFFATQNLNPGGAIAGVTNNHEIGVFYSVVREQWGVYNEDAVNMTPNAAFNIFIPLSGSCSFLHTSSAGNILNNWTNLAHPAAEDEDALVFAIHNYNPGAGSGEYHNFHLGVWYSLGDQWAIFNQDGTTMPQERDFNVYIVPPFQVAITHTATVANSDGSLTYLDHPLLNGHPGAMATVTQNWTVSGEEVYNDHPAGVLYDTVTRRWAIFNESGAPMPAGAGFNVLIAPGRNYLPFFAN